MIKREVKSISGYKDTLLEMAKLVKKSALEPKVRQLAVEIAGNTENISPRSRNRLIIAKKIFNYVQRNIRYQRDPKFSELLMDAGNVLKSRSGDCDDFTILICSLLESIGLDSVFIIYKIQADAFSHISAGVRIQGKIFTMDAINKEEPFGWETDYREKQIIDFKQFEGFKQMNDFSDFAGRNSYTGAYKRFYKGQSLYPYEAQLLRANGIVVPQMRIVAPQPKQQTALVQAGTTASNALRTVNSGTGGSGNTLLLVAGLAAAAFFASKFIPTRSRG
jgi:hypothetical protein